MTTDPKTPRSSAQSSLFERLVLLEKYLNTRYLGLGGVSRWGSRLVEIDDLD